MGKHIPQAVAYIYDQRLSQHVLREGHPMQPGRLRSTKALLDGYRAFEHSKAELIEARFATPVELHSFHSEEYIDAVYRLSQGEKYAHSERVGFSELGDNPVYRGMYEAASLSAGASIRAAELLADHKAITAFAPAGGLHHAQSDRASGFCVFNDPVLAINTLRQRGLRVCYVDIDAHHGDGVQNAFYADSDVLTISMHESGRWLFPGTGEVSEVGSSGGAGYSVNLPLLPYTSDEVFLEAFAAVVLPLIRAFDPDILATQLGVDAYITDPLTHLALTTNGFEIIFRQFASMGYPWLAFGGGGYDIEAVPRCWTLAYGVMLGSEWPDGPVGSVGVTGLDGKRLRDDLIHTDSNVIKRTRDWADDQIEEIRRIIFPYHHL